MALPKVASPRFRRFVGSSMNFLPLRFRWALRDLRARWLQVAGIACMIAIGTGLASGLQSSTQWRTASNEASIELTNMYELRARLAGDTRLPRGTLAEIASNVDGVEVAEERLIFESQIEIEAPDGTVFVPSRIIGVDLSDGGPHVNGVVPAVGRGIEASEIGESVVLIERNFGVFYDIPGQGELRLGGGTTLQFVGQATSPEYFLVVEGGNVLAQANLAVIFTSLETAQDLSNSRGMVNDLVLTLQPGAEIDEVEAALLTEIERNYPETNVITSTRADDAAYVALTADVEGDAAIYNVLSFILFGGAAFAALNFAARIVETQRREIGASMALGVKPIEIAVRPILVGLQIAVLGVVFGLIMGWLISRMMAGVIEDFLVVPVFSAPFQFEVFFVTAAIGLLVPIAAVLWPVYRAVRVQPVEAIRTGHLASRGGGLAPLVSSLPLPGKSLMRMPFRNLLRAPRRTFLTLVALSTVLAIMFAVIGMRDSFITTLSQGNEELLGKREDRLIVNLNDFHPTDSDIVASILANPVLRSTETVLTVGASIHAREGHEYKGAEFSDLGSAADAVLYGSNEASLQLSLQLLDFRSELWTPTARDGNLDIGRPGIVLARKAASDLGVNVSDNVVLSHPKSTDQGTFTIGSTNVDVIAIHGHPIRSVAYIDVRQAELLGLTGITNGITAVPQDGFSLVDVKRELFEVPGIATVEGFSEGFKAIRDLFEQFSAIFLVIAIVILGLALLIAFNTANISVEERARDHATMFAFGVSVGKVVLNLAIEGLILGVFSTAIGIVLGYVLLVWIIVALVPNGYPDLGIIFAVNVAQISLLLAIAVAVVALAPVLSVRKLQRMDVPSTLRVLE